MKVVCVTALLMLLPGCSLEFSGSVERVIDTRQCRIVTRQHADARLRIAATNCGPGVVGALCRVLRSTK